MLTAAPRRLVLPPPYTQHWEPRGDILDAAVAAAGEGAGTLLWRHLPGAAPGRLDLAVVLEPDEALAGARRAFLAGMVALAEAVAAHGPPDRPIRFLWPGELRFDAARLGGARLAVAPGTAEDAVPDWMVFAAELIADRDHLADPGARPDSTSLAEEGVEDPAAIVESFAAHLMRQFDRWRHEGFVRVADDYALRLGTPVTEAGEIGGGARLADALAAPPWRDAAGVRL